MLTPGRSTADRLGETLLWKLLSEATRGGSRLVGESSYWLTWGRMGRWLEEARSRLTSQNRVC